MSSPGREPWVPGLHEISPGRAAEAIAAGEAPAELAEAWSGPYRYGVSGSLVAWIDDHWGRATLREALEFTSWKEFEARLGMTEPEFLAGWENWVTSDCAPNTVLPSADRADVSAETLSAA